MSNKIIIIGAGASHAIDSKYPVMDNFFSVVANHSDTDTVATLLATLDYERAFIKGNPLCETRGVEYLALARLTNPPSVTNILRDEYLKLCQQRFQTASNANENLEEVLNKCVADKKIDSQNSLLYLIGLLFSQENGSLEKKADEVYHPFFDAVLGNEQLATIVSFNYDVVLDCSLIRWLSKKCEITDWGLKQLFTRIDAFSGTLNAPKLPNWLALEGCFPDPPACDKFASTASHLPSRLRLVKPHGSLAFARRREDDDKKECCLLLKEKNFGVFPNHHTRIIDYFGKDRFPEIIPLIVPPTLIKVKSYPILYEAERTFLETIENPNTKQIMVIGWSLPPTDMDHFNAIRSRILKRSPQHQLEELVVIDKRPTNNDDHFDKMEAMFQPKTMKRIHSGFSSETAKLL